MALARAPLPRDASPLDLRAAGDDRAALERPSRVTAATQRPPRWPGCRSRCAAGAGRACASRWPRWPGRGSSPAWRPSSCRAARSWTTRERYGVDFDVLAFNAFGDQTAAGIERGLRRPGGDGAASYTSYPMLVDGRTVPGLSVTPIRGESGPTILEGEPVRHDDEVVLGVDTADRLGVEVGDEVAVQPAAAYSGRSAAPAHALRVVGLATFAAISQQGADEARLGVGALVTRPTFEAAHRLRRGPARVDRRPPGRRHRPDRADRRPPGGRRGRPRASRRGGSPTARPAELVQLDEASPGARRRRSWSSLLLARRRARPRWLVADASERPRARGAPGPRVLALASSPAPRPGRPSRRASPPWPSACRSASPSVDSRSAPSPDRSRWWTTRAHRPGSSWRWCWPSSRRSASRALVAGQVAAPRLRAPPPSATPKAAAPDRPARCRADAPRWSGPGLRMKSRARRGRASGRSGRGGRPSSPARRARPGRGWRRGGSATWSRHRSRRRRGRRA